MSDPDKPNGSFMLGSTKLTLGGFIELAGYYRSRNENRGTGTGYASLPFYGPTPQGDSPEFGLSAQQSRIAATLEAPVGPASGLKAYFEMDFENGAGGVPLAPSGKRGCARKRKVRLVIAMPAGRPGTWSTG